MPTAETAFVFTVVLLPFAALLLWKTKASISVTAQFNDYPPSKP